MRTVWNIATSSLLPGTKNVHCLFMAREWLMKQGLPMPSAIDKAKAKAKDGAFSGKVSANGKRASKSSR